MKRQHVIVGFASASLVLAAVSVSQFVELRSRQSINQAVRDVPTVMTSEEFTRASDNSDKQSALEVQFAQANALLNGGNLELAEKHLGMMTQNSEHPALALAAQYNLANGYLREALNTDTSNGRYRSLIELSKQRYRDLLAGEPDYWNARYNLERALRLSPEKETYEVDDKGKPIKSVSVAFPGFEDRELP